MNATAAAEILTLHERHGLDFKASVLFLIKVNGFDIGALERDIDRTRGALHMALDGVCQPNEAMRIAVKQRIGLDPWAWQETRRASRPGSRGGRRSRSTRSP